MHLLQNSLLISGQTLVKIGTITLIVAGIALIAWVLIYTIKKKKLDRQLEAEYGKKRK